MASSSSRAHVSIVLDGVQAQRILNALANEAKNARNELQAMQDKMNKGEFVDPKKFKEQERYVKQLESDYKKNTQQLSDLNEVMKHLSSQTSRQLDAALRSIAKVLKDVDASTDEGKQKMAELRGQFSAISQQAKRLAIDYVDVANAVRNLGTTSTATIEKAIRQHKEERAQLDPTSAAYKRMTAELTAMNRELDKRNGKMTGQRAGALASGSITGSADEVKQAISYFEKLRDSMNLSNTKGLDVVNQKLQALNALLGNTQKGEVDVKNVLQNLDTVSNATLTKAVEQQKKYVDSLKLTDPAYKTELDNLNKLNLALDTRNGKMTATSADKVFNDPTGASADQIKRTIEYYEKYKASLKSTDTRAIQNVEQRLRVLRKQQLENIQTQRDFDRTINNLKTASIDQLRAAEARLNEELKHAVGSQQEYANKAKQLADVRKQIQGLTGDFQKQESSLKQVFSRLAAYVGVYGAFNMIRTRVTSLIKTNLEFSDTLSDIRKTTLMSEEAVALLSDRLKELDTRTAVIDVQKLAYEAGKLGITGVANVSEFVKAADQVNIALGEQLNGLESITELMKINQVLGTTSQYGIEQSLLKTGSAINYLSQTSTAVGGRMTDFTARLAGISASAHITTAEVLGLSAASDALKQQVEVSATAFNKLISQMFTNTKRVADAVGIQFDTLKEKLEMGDTMDALLMVLDAVRKKGGLSETGPIMKDLGSDGARLLQVLNAMATNVDFVRERVTAANKAFREGTSVTNEYNIKNENAAALWERLKNNMEKLFVSATNTGWIKELIVDLQDLPKWLDRMAVGLVPIKLAVEAIVWSLQNMAWAWAGFISAFTVVNIVNGAKAVWFAIKAWAIAIRDAEGAAAKFKAVFAGNVWMIGLTIALSVVYKIVDGFKEARAEAEAFDRALSEGLKVAELEEKKLANIKQDTRQIFDRLIAAQQDLAAATKAYGKDSKDAAEAQKDLQNAEQERRTAIRNFNDSYGQYLGYQLAETANYEDMATAIDAVNAKLRMKALLEAKANRETQIYADTAQGVTESYTRSKSSIMSVTGMDEAAAAVAFDYIKQHPEQFFKRTEDGKWDTLALTAGYNLFAQMYGTAGDGNMDVMFRQIGDYLNKVEDQRRKVAASNDAFEAELRDDARRHDETVAPNIQKMWQEISEFVNVTDEKQLEIMKAQTGEVRDARSKQVQQWLAGARLDAESLQHLTDEDSQARLAALQQQMLRAEAYLEKQVLRTTPTQKEADAANREALRGARDEYQAIISKIEAFYQMQRQIVNDQFEQEKIDTVSRDNAMREIEQRLLQSRIMARKRIVDKATQDEWEAEQQMMRNFNIAGQEGLNQLEVIAGVSLTRIGNLLKNLGGDAEWDAVFRKAEEDETTQQNKRIERIIALEKMLLEHNALGKVTADYEKVLRELDLISDRFRENGENDLRAYYRRMMEIARTVGQQAGRVDLSTPEGIQQGRELLMASGMSDQQANSMNPSEMRAFFYQAYKYAEDYASTSQKLAKKTLDAWEKTYSLEGNDDYYDRRIQQYEQMAKIAERMEQYGLSEAVALENQLTAQTALYQKEKDRLDAKLQKAMADRQAAENINDDPTRRTAEISKADEEIKMVEQEYEALIPLYEKMMDAALSLEEFNHRWVVSMKDAFVELGDSFISFRSFYEDNGSMVSNIFGTVDERKSAFADFVDSMKKATRTAIMEKVKQSLSMKLQDNIDLAWRKMFLNKQAAEEQIADAKRLAAKAVAHTAEQGMQASSDAIIEGENAAHNAALETQDAAHTVKDTALSQASGVAKAFAQLGPVAGAVAVAMITAVIGSFLTMALNAVGHQNHGLNANAANKTKLVSGMLTYDAGNATTALATVPSGSPLGVTTDTGRHYRAVTDYAATGLLTRPTITTVGGTPALVAEEGPELVVGRATTRTLMMDYPGIVATILNIERHHRRAQAHRAYALHAFDDGNAADLLGTSQPNNLTTSQPNNLSEETIQALTLTIAALNDRLQHPITAELNANGKGGATDRLAQSMYDSLRRGDLDSVKRLFKAK